MKRSFTVVVAAAIVAALSVSLSAQWPRHPHPGVPKGPDGKPNLTAPAPRTSDGKPDLSGIWMRTNRTEAPGSQPAGRPPLAMFANVGAGFKEGLPSQPWVADLLKKREGALDNPDALCLPQGPLEYHLDPQPREIVQLPHKTLIVYESNYGLGTSTPTAGAFHRREGRSRTGTGTPSADGRATRSWSSRTTSGAP